MHAFLIDTAVWCAMGDVTAELAKLSQEPGQAHPLINPAG